MFVDDLLLFGKTNEEAMNHFKESFDSYASWYGQQVILKSSIYFKKNDGQEKYDELISLMDV